MLQHWCFKKGHNTEVSLWACFLLTRALLNRIFSNFYPWEHLLYPCKVHVFCVTGDGPLFPWAQDTLLSKLDNFHSAIFISREGRSMEVIQLEIALNKGQSCFTFLFSRFCRCSYIDSALKGVAVRRWERNCVFRQQGHGNKKRKPKLLHLGNSRISKGCRQVQMGAEKSAKYPVKFITYSESTCSKI